MPLVEIVRTPQTSPKALATALALVQRLGKTKVVVGDCVGFLVNRLLSPYMNEAGYLLAEVDDLLEIERAAIEFGMPMGPLELTDLVGLEVAAHVAANMHAAYGDRMRPAPLWKTLQDQQARQPSRKLKLIEKSRRGKQVNVDVLTALRRLPGQTGAPRRSSLDRETITQRLIFPIINEAALCLDEGIVRSADDVDLAMVFGTGFAPFRGGPLRYAASMGIAHIVERLMEFAAHEPRLAPSDALRRFAHIGFAPSAADQRAPAVA
jgi:3-hydroxyacyl-CoA dehydrogenase/enoyl-CoA hydratase/3-hydroxybutyryl-CoA epimerase